MPLGYPENVDPSAIPHVVVTINEEWYSYLLGFFDFALDRSFWEVTDAEWENIQQAIYWIMAQPYGVDMAQIKVGSYVGDGAASKGVTGVGFAPDLVLIYAQNDGNTNRGIAIRSLSDSAALCVDYVGSIAYVDEQLMALGSDGFTVNSSSAGGTSFRGNVNARTYTYLALKG